nr:SDR family NAD(P)-dependent oxidoreductase [Streptomyces paludis]
MTRKTQRRRWTVEQIPDQTGRVTVVTGASSGLGLATARALHHRGGRVILAVRDEERGRRAVAEITAAGRIGAAERAGGSPESRPLGSRSPQSRPLDPSLLEVRRLDLADLDSVRAFSDRLHSDHARLDVLINNAGVMAPPRTLNALGHESQFACNHLGHFALTGLLLDLLTAGRDPRVVTVSSVNHRQGRLRFDDLDGARGYAPMAFYNQSKFANAVFGQELHLRLTEAASPVRSLLAHPGYTATGLQLNGPTGIWQLLLGRIGNPLLAQSPAAGALSQLYAATDPEAVGGEFIGPDGPAELRGAPTRVPLSPAAADPETGRRLWEVSERMTGVRFAFPATA